MRKRMNKMKLLGLFFMAFLFILACGVKKDAPKNTLGKDDAGRELELAVGEMIFVTLDSNPTTGYLWGIAEVNETVLKQVGETEYVHEKSFIRTFGSGGEEIFNFEAVGVGETDLQLIYHRPWDENVAPVDVFSVYIVVK